MPASPWIRAVELEGRRVIDRPRHLIWLSTGDVICELEMWPCCRLPQPCALCGYRIDPFFAPLSPLLSEGVLLWYCQRCIVTTEGLYEKIVAKKEATLAEVDRRYPYFWMSAPPGEEWQSPWHKEFHAL